MRLIDIAGIGAGFSGAIIAGLVVGFVLARQTGSGLWIVVGLFGGMLLGGVAVGRRLWSLMREDTTIPKKLR